MAMTLKEGKYQSRISPPPLSSRSSSSFYRDGNGRTLFGSPVEGDEPAVSASVATTATTLASLPLSTC